MSLGLRSATFDSPINRNCSYEAWRRLCDGGDAGDSIFYVYAYAYGDENDYVCVCDVS